ncbi:MAG: hypothetical protein WBI41_05695 [Azovibrio sp.]|uniref:hypothetical protein n=1 Tax=Azovibrio sp. TaxID=1872673 RepID=UPI003C78E84D
MDYKVIEEAGLAKSEAAHIVGVSDVMMWRYVKDGHEPREFYAGRPLRRRMQVFLAVLRKLVAAGKLPAKDIPFAKRMHPDIAERRGALVSKLKSIVDSKVVESATNT